MLGERTTFLAASAAMVLGLASAGAAAAAGVTAGPTSPNYTFPNGYQGFALETHGGPINPGIVVGFNPQPDPPGDDAGALITILTPTEAELFSPSTGGAFAFGLSLIGMGDGSVIPLPDAPDDGHHTSWSGVLDGHNVDVMLGFGPGPVDPASWSSFNPQPDPPGDFLGGAFSFQGAADPIMTLSIDIDDTPLSFTLAPGTPEPAGWAMMLLGFGGLGAMLRARRGLAAA